MFPELRIESSRGGYFAENKKTTKIINKTNRCFAGPLRARCGPKRANIRLKFASCGPACRVARGAKRAKIRMVFDSGPPQAQAPWAGRGLEKIKAT